MSPFRTEAEMPPEPGWRRVCAYIGTKIADVWDWYWIDVSHSDKWSAFFFQPLIALFMMIAAACVFVWLPIAIIIGEYQKPCDDFAFVREQVTAVDGTPVEVQRKVCLKLKSGRTLDDLRRWTAEHPEENFK